MIYAKEKNYTLYQGKMQDVLDTLEENSIDSIVCDPPYELNFMGKGWDNQGVAFQPDTWKHCYRVLKDGGYLLAFGGSRTFHRIACAIEDAGFEIRDTIMWLYGSGFPKSMNIGLAIDKKNGVESKVIGNGKSGVSSRAYQSEETTTAGNYEIKQAQNEWNGWGTSLKPAYEPIIVARKPFKGSLVDNVIKNGVGGINIDECRVGDEERKNPQAGFIRRGRTDEEVFLGTDKNRPKGTLTVNGRFPANVILTYDETDFEEVCGGFPDTKGGGKIKEKGKFGFCFDNGKRDSKPMADGYDDSGSASRYFYCAKASKKDRDEGLENFETKTKVFNGKSDSSSEDMKDAEKRFTTNGKNIHPTVKPIKLMQYLVRLVTPKNATILDCFMGSGSTGKAVMFENRERNANYYFIGIEMIEEYLPICKARIDYASNKYEYDFQKQSKEEKDKGQLSIFDFTEEDEL